jgi:phage repressor protein C with HTH and peptisase S24 domain
MPERKKKTGKRHLTRTEGVASASKVAPRIGEVADAVGGNSALARICGVSESSIRNWRSGASEPTASDLVEIARAGDVTVEWLATGADPKRRSAFSKIGLGRDAAVLFAQRRSTVPQGDVPRLMEEAAEYQLDVEGLEQRHGADYPKPSLVGDFIMVPRYDIASSAGPGALVAGEQIVDYLAFRADWVKNAIGVAPKYLALISVKGDSMAPTLSDGDLILVDRSREAVEDSGVYVIHLNDALLVKRVQRHLNGALTVRSDNDRYAPEHVAAENVASFRVVGRVVWACRRF